jgi:hypothetical protein
MKYVNSEVLAMRGSWPTSRAEQKRIAEKIGKRQFSVVNFRPEEILGSVRVGPLNSLSSREIC